MSKATITVPFATTQRAPALPSRITDTKVRGLNAERARRLRRSLMAFVRDTREALQGFAAYGFVFMLMYWMGAFLYAAL